MAKKTYQITPFNEGQELNYVETYKFTRAGAIIRATYMAKRLADILERASISVEVRDSTDRLVFYGKVLGVGHDRYVQDMTKEM